MSAFRAYERKVIEILMRPQLESNRIRIVLDEAGMISCAYTGVGYFLTVRHPALPSERHVYNSPLLTGRCGALECGFVVFQEHGELTLECHSWDGSAIPDDFRDRQVRIEPAP